MNLNYLRKKNPQLAGLVSQQMLDNVFIQSGIPFDMSKSSKRGYQLMEKMLDANLEVQEIKEGGPQRKVREGAGEEKRKRGKGEDEGSSSDEESVLAKTHRDIKSHSHHTEKKVVQSHKVSQEDIDNARS